MTKYNWRGEEMAQFWEITGGADAGGLMVREGTSVNSAKVDARLATGAVVKQLALQEFSGGGGRLQFELVRGAGPATGWISLTGKTGNALCVKCDEPSGGEDPSPPEGDDEGSDRTPTEKIAERCRKENARKQISWSPVSIDHVNENHQKRSKGMFYGLEFPWNEKMLLEFGASWLTKAFHAAGTLERSNAVTRIVEVKAHNFGNNGGKSLFEVEYKKPSPDLHTKLFAKYPFDMADRKQQADSIAQRVYKQPQDFTEVNFYRLMETYIPFKTPKFYYGDISNESTNFIMITEQVNFDDPHTAEPLAPFQIEGPYDKAMDYDLRGSAADYYYVLVRKGAIMAAMHKSGKLAPAEIIDQFENTGKKPPEMWGMQPGVSGDPMFASKLKTGESFMFETAPKIFPPEAIDPAFQKKWRETMLLVNAYQAEHAYYRHGLFPDYVAFTHQNLNVDNAFFWRDEQGHLDAGIFDWGNIKAMGLGHMFYWWLYTAEWGVLCEHRQPLMECFVKTYHEEGGPLLDVDRYATMYFMAALEHNCEVVKAVPLMYKMVPKKVFATITDRKDERIFQTIDGKSTCRVYLHTWCNAVRMLLEWNAADVLEKFMEELTQPPFNIPRKKIDA